MWPTTETFAALFPLINKMSNISLQDYAKNFLYYLARE